MGQRQRFCKLKFTVPDTAFYNIKICYMPLEGSERPIEISILVINRFHTVNWKNKAVSLLGKQGHNS